MKKIYMSRSIDELRLIASKIPNLQGKRTKTLIESGKNIHAEAERAFHCGDEELAYVLFMRYVEISTYVSKQADYLVHKPSGNNRRVRAALDRLEMLNTSLTERYNRLHVSSPASLITRPLTPSTSGKIKSPNACSTLIANHSLNDFEYESLSASDKFDILMASSGLLTCKELFEQVGNSKVLVMDCRPSADYFLSHLIYQWSFNVPEELITAGMSAGKLQARLDSETKAMWSARCAKDQIVLMDWNTKEPDPPSDSCIAILKDILQNWDPDVTYRSPIKILEGGYEYFIMMYPTMCTNPAVQAPQQNNNDIDLIEEIEYPSLRDITMKEDIKESFSISTNRHRSSGGATTATLRPNVDRSSKLAAEKTYNARANLITELRKDQQELIDKAQVNDEKLKLATERWLTILNKKPQATTNENNVGSTEKEIMYTLMELESRAEDYKNENIRLREELESFKRLRSDQKEQLSPLEVQDFEQAAKQIETMIQEREIFDEINDQGREQRKKQSENIRDSTLSKPRNIQANNFESGETKLSLMPTPQFDRSMKPQLPSATTLNPAADISSNRIRDFSPVIGATGRGLTGLKNLGNTCYMNSILQCLSNTYQLAEYCLSERYKNYINRSNRTRGIIVEEVAALIQTLWTGSYRCVASKDLRSAVGRFQNIFGGFDQQDSHEFLTILMDWLHSDLQTLEVQEELRETLTPSKRAWMEFTKAKESHILRLFYGQLKSIVKCKMCLKESATYECFSSLSLELPANSNDCYLAQCLDMYFSGERIDGWHCPTCKKKQPAIKTLGVSKLPPILIIHLKRFYADTETVSQSYKKKQNYVRFSLDNMDMTSYITKSESRTATPKSYQLYGVSNHYGSMEGGHYTAFCKSSQNGRWYKFDDQVVSSMETSYVHSSAAYILFYARLPMQN